MTNSVSVPRIDPQTCFRASLMDVLAGRAGIDGLGLSKFLANAQLRLERLASLVVVTEDELLNDLNRRLVQDAEALLRLAAHETRNYRRSLILALTALEQGEAAAGWLGEEVWAENNRIRSCYAANMQDLAGLLAVAAETCSKRGKAGAGTTSYSDELLELAGNLAASCPSDSDGTIHFRHPCPDSDKTNLRYPDVRLLAVLAHRQALKEQTPAWKIGIHYFAGVDEVVPVHDGYLPVLQVRLNQQIVVKLTDLPTSDEIQIRVRHSTGGFEAARNVRDLAEEVTLEKCAWNNSITTPRRVIVEVHEKTGLSDDRRTVLQKLIKTFVCELQTVTC